MMIVPAKYLKDIPPIHYKYIIARTITKKITAIFNTKIQKTTTFCKNFIIYKECMLYRRVLSSC